VTLPSVNQTIQSNGLGQSPAPSSDLCVVVGCTSSGTARSLRKFAARQVSKLVAEFGVGPASQAAALHLAAGQACLVYKTPSTNPGTQGVDGTGNDVTYTGTGSSVITLTGASLDSYSVQLEVITGGTIGSVSPKIVFQISLDGGVSFGARVSLGAANSYLIPNTGITLHFAAGTLVAGDSAVFLGIAPKWASGDLTTALSDLLATFPNKAFGFIHIIGPMSASEAAVVKSSLASLESGTVYVHAECEARGQDPGEDEDDWSDALEADYASFTSERMAIGAGAGRLVSPIDASSYLRPMTWDLAVRVAAIPVEQEPGRVRTGPMNITITDSNNDLIGHDERVSPGLDDNRFATLFTIPGLSGCYVANGNLMSPAGSDFTLIPFRRVMDLVSTYTYQQLVLELSDDVFINRETGFILEEEAKRIENAVNQVLYERVVKPGHAVSAQLIVSRDDDLLGGSPLTSETLVIPKAIIKTIENTLRFVNPALEVTVAP
jgi:uncharacterized protein DUF2586